jgi:hypothetical protein
LRGDEEEAGRQEGRPEEEEVVLNRQLNYAGGGTPQRHSYNILYSILKSSKDFKLNKSPLIHVVTENISEGLPLTTIDILALTSGI